MGLGFSDRVLDLHRVRSAVTAPPAASFPLAASSCLNLGRPVPPWTALFRAIATRDGARRPLARAMRYAVVEHRLARLFHGAPAGLPGFGPARSSFSRSCGVIHLLLAAEQCLERRTRNKQAPSDTQDRNASKRTTPSLRIGKVAADAEHPASIFDSDCRGLGICWGHAPPPLNCDAVCASLLA